MAEKAEMRVYLVGSTSDPEKVVGVAIRRCYSDKPVTGLLETVTPEKRGELIRMVESVGHTSTTEHTLFTVAVEGISRIATHQLVRHRLASYSQESQRYVDLSKKPLVYIMPPSIEKRPKAAKLFAERMNQAEKDYKDLLVEGVLPEDARFVLPHNVETKIVVSLNARGWNEMLTKRLCRRAQWEIRGMAIAATKLLRNESPNLFDNVGPTCKTQGICWEGKKSCGLWKQIEGGELRVRGKHKFKDGVRNDLSFIDE